MSCQYGDLFDPEVANQQVLKIPNKSTKTKARSSIPDVLVIKKVNDCVRVFAKRSLSRATQFGPMDAPLVTKNEVDESKFLIKLNIGKCKRLENADAAYIYYDTADENMCNRMMFVQPAKFFAEQNLCAHQEEDFIFYTTTRDIPPDEELKVWYSPSYAKFMSVSVLTPTSGMINISDKNDTRKKGRKPKTSVRMQVYLNSIVSERDVRSVPPKKRGWRRSKDKRLNGGNSTSGLMYPNSSDPKRVVRKTFVRIPKIYECHICRKTFKTGNKLRIHSVAHLAERNFLCQYCGFTYKRSDKLHEHITNKHRTNVVKVRKEGDIPPNLDTFPFKCRDCGVGFQRRGMFINHIINKHPDLRTSDFAELNNPILKTVRDFVCPYCGKVYKSSTKRKLHILKDHPGQKLPPSIRKKNGVVNGEAAAVISKEQVPVKPVSCPHCAGQYTTKYKMKRHVKDKHPEAGQSADTLQVQPQIQGDMVQVVQFARELAAPVPYPGMSHSHKHGMEPRQISHEAPAVIEVQPHDEMQVAYEAVSMDARIGPQHRITMTDEQNNASIISTVPMTIQQDGIQHVFTISPGDINTPNASDLLTQAMSALEHPGPSELPATTYQDTRCDSYSRYAGGRKQMLLKSYEDGQHAAALQSHQTTQYIQQKQQPYKNRVLNSVNTWRQQATLPVEPYQYNQNPLAELPHSNPVSQYHVHYPVLGPTNTMLDPTNEELVPGERPEMDMQVENGQTVSDQTLLHAICSDQHVDSSTLETSELAAIYHNNSAVNWSYHTTGEIPMSSSYISR